MFILDWQTHYQSDCMGPNWNFFIPDLIVGMDMFSAICVSLTSVVNESFKIWLQFKKYFGLQDPSIHPPLYQCTTVSNHLLWTLLLNCGLRGVWHQLEISQTMVLLCPLLTSWLNLSCPHLTFSFSKSGTLSRINSPAPPTTLFYFYSIVHWASSPFLSYLSLALFCCFRCYHGDVGFPLAQTFHQSLHPWA